jgi:signal transduction histidine kinase/FixJ family two-component response regulator
MAPPLTDHANHPGHAAIGRRDVGSTDRHVVRFYDDGEQLMELVGGFVAAAVARGDSSVVLATRPHQDALARRLEVDGIDLAGLSAAGRYVALDPDDTLGRILVEGWPDGVRFEEVVGGAVSGAARAAGSGRVAAFGEMVTLLWERGSSEAALRLEELWDDLVNRSALSILCAYPMRCFGRVAHRAGFQRVCDRHDRVLPVEGVATRPRPAERDRAIAELQQQAASLQAEIADRRRLERELQRRVQQLAEADRRKDEFLATLAHELRNPLAPIRMALTLHRSRPADGPRYLDIVDRQAENLARLVDDLLDASRITRGKIELRRERVGIDAIVSRALDATRDLLERRGHALALTLPGEMVEVSGDPVRLEQVLVNLLANAAKYTPAGGRISVDVEAPGGDAVIRVRDTGVGMSPELLDRVFDLFSQAERTIDRAQGGLGIGLTLARRLVELHGGTIVARSDGPGHGAEFVVLLPRAAERAAPAAADGAVPPLAAEAALRVLVVDDNGDAAEVLAALLRAEGHEVCAVVGDGATALRAAAEHRPDVVLLDLGLPVLDGFEVARRLREGGSEAALVAISGYGQVRDRERSASAGFAAHLVKPVRLEALATALRGVQAVGRDEAARCGGEAQASPVRLRETP